MIMKKEDIWKNDELRFYKMFKILQRLFEKSIEIDIEKEMTPPIETDKSPENSNNEKDKQETKHTKTDTEASKTLLTPENLKLDVKHKVT